MVEEDVDFCGDLVVQFGGVGQGPGAFAGQDRLQGADQRGCCAWPGSKRSKLGPCRPKWCSHANCLMLVYLDRGELPEAVTLVLRPKGKYRIPRSRNLRSRHGLSSCRLKWRVVELWTIPVEDLHAGLLTILGGRKIMLESPLIDELVMEKYGELLTEKTREAARETSREIWPKKSSWLSTQTN